MRSQLPKVVLHDHLDGGVRVGTVIELAARAGYAGLPAAGPDDLARWFDQSESGSLEGYLESFRHTVAVMQTQPALERVAYEAVVDLAADGVVYAEVRFAPSLSTSGGLTRHEVVEAVLAGLRRGEQEAGITTGLIVVAMRNRDDSVAVAQVAIDLSDAGVVGFDLAGPEKGFPADDHLVACRLIREASLGLTLHAGEADGPESIWRALQRCGAHRVGHGVRLLDDCRVQDSEVVELGSLASYVRDHRVPLEVCVTSNLHTGGYGPAQHPVGALHRAGFAVTLNTDNRLMSRTSMSEEFAVVVDHHGFTSRDLRTVTERAMMAAFCSLPTKELIVTERIRPAYEAAV